MLPTQRVQRSDAPKESRNDMLVRPNEEAENRTITKEAKQHTLVAIEVKPWETGQDVMAPSEKITLSIPPEGLQWGKRAI